MSNTTEPCCWVLLSHFEISSLRYLISRQAALLSLGLTFPLTENVFLSPFLTQGSCTAREPFPPRGEPGSCPLSPPHSTYPPQPPSWNRIWNKSSMKLLEREGTLAKLDRSRPEEYGTWKHPFWEESPWHASATQTWWVSSPCRALALPSHERRCTLLQWSRQEQPGKLIALTNIQCISVFSNRTWDRAWAAVFLRVEDALWDGGGICWEDCWWCFFRWEENEWEI